MLDPCSVLVAVSNGNGWNFEKEKYIQEWIRKRNDIVVMNQTIMTGTIVCSIGALCLGVLLPDWSMHPQEHWHWILTLIAVGCLHLIIWYVTGIVRIGIAIVIAGVFKLRRTSREWLLFI